MRHLTLAMLALAAAAGTASAQTRGRPARDLTPPPSGLLLNVHAFAMPGFSIKGQDIAGAIKTSMGPGIGAQIGYVFASHFMVFADVDIARLGAAGDQTGHWGLGFIELGGRVCFPTANQRITPYVAASFGGRGLGAEAEGLGGDVTFGGIAVSGGGGLTYALSRSLALDGGVMLSLGKFGDYEDPFQKGDLTVDNTLTTRIRFGLNWRP
jgi:hypothetical protein